MRSESFKDGVVPKFIDVYVKQCLTLSVVYEKPRLKDCIETMKIDADSTIDDHFKAIRAQGEAYLSKALKQNASPVMRERILMASFRYFELRQRTNSSAGQLSQSSQAIVPSQAAATASGPDSSFQSLIASALDHDMSTQVLIDSCAKAADYQLSQILVKCLFILASSGSICDEKAKTGDNVVESQSQYEDEELFGVPDSDEENVNPQTGQLQGGQSQGQKPKAPSAVGRKRKDPPHEVSVGRTGQSFVDEFVSRLIANSRERPCSQTKSNDAFVSAVAKEAPLSESASKNVLQLLTRRMRNVDLFELPPYIYQLLLFASARGNSAAKSDILIQITRVFSELEAKTRKSEEVSLSMLEEDEDAITPSSTTPKELRQVQGTALLHIEYAVKQDPVLSAEIVKLAKSGVETPKHFLTAFGTGILLSLARATSSQSDILHVLREAISRFSKEMSLRKRSLYAARVSMNDENIVDARKSVLFVADCTCEIGWDDLKESLMNFAFFLLDKPLSNAISTGPDAANLGEDLLFKLFSSHSVIRESILEHLTTRIALQEKSAQQAICVIRNLAERIPFCVLEHSRYVRDGIEFLVTLPPWMAAALIAAYKPLLLARQDLKDYFQLVIRKSLFHRDSSSRAVAITGFLTVMSLCSSSAVGSQSQGTGGRRLNSTEHANLEAEAMLDAIQPIRRIFSYSAALRALLYKTTIHHLQGADDEPSSRMAAAIGEILRCHLQTFVDPQNAPYILIEHCVDECSGGALVEPLGDLVWCMAVVESKRNLKSYQASYIIDLAQKLARVSLQDFSISKDLVSVSNGAGNGADGEIATQSAEEATARANRNRIRVLGSVCEALIHAVLIMTPESQTWTIVTETLVPLLVLKGRVFELLRSVGVSSASDAFNDLGGDLAIEQLRPGMRMLLQRGGKSSNQKGKKRPGSRKAKSGEGNSGSGAGAVQVSGHRFGIFSVLSSASSKPTLPLSVAMRTLQVMSDAISQENNDARNAFHGQAESRDFQELRVYLLAVAQKHTEDFISFISKESHVARLQSDRTVWETNQAIDGLVRMAMGDFKRFRRSASNTPGQGGIAALQIAERCACALMYFGILKKPTVSAFCKALMLERASSGSEREGEEETFEGAAGALERLVDSLIDDELFKEAAVTLRMHESVVISVIGVLENMEKISTFRDKRVQWATDALFGKHISDAGIVKTLVQTCLVYTENNNDLRRAGHLCLRLLEVIGDCDENAVAPEVDDNEDEKLCSAQSVTQETSLAVVDAIIDVIDRAICDVEWCLSRMSSLESSVGTSSIEADSSHFRENQEESVDALQQEVTAKQAIRAEDAAQVRLEGIVRTLRGLARCAIAKWSQQERLLKLITKTYKVICSATQAQAKRRGDPRTTFTSLINECKGLAPTLWTYLAFVGAETMGAQSLKGASRAAREARVMPQLVYEVERFEKVLIGAQKRTKINLLRGMRRNIARDFRIREDLLREERNSDDDPAEQNEQDDKPRPNRAKKRRT